ncbi:MAG TPA: hypothetical protein VF658_15110 [Pyrinomonadaceae bacterium]|jgi:hypothetical protein
MKDSQIRHLDRSQRVRQLVFNLVPPFPEDSRAMALAAIVNEVIIEVEVQAARQVAANLEWQESTEQKRVAIKALLQEMRPMNRTARAADNQSPGIADQFKMPPDIDQVILNTARAYINTATPIPHEFTTRGLPASFLADMQRAIDAVLAAEARQSAALAAQTAATAAIAAALKREREAVSELDVIMRNRYRDDPATLAAWKSASHIERAPKRAKKDTTTPPTPAE